ncbi:hypothetical protein BPA01_20920 [Brevibacillus parabrevis]|uniref:Uncharacterized protein n=2 Tax=Brevibacillus TaxID=55080 RepID=A0A4Y3PDL2_BREPA|nr:hypothetical protein BPA01_20920 [Brevibacillus parabrevis]
MAQMAGALQRVKSRRAGMDSAQQERIGEKEAGQTPDAAQELRESTNLRGRQGHRCLPNKKGEIKLWQNS